MCGSGGLLTGKRAPQLSCASASKDTRQAESIGDVGSLPIGHAGHAPAREREGGILDGCCCCGGSEMKEEAGKAAGEASKCSWTCERCSCGCCMCVSKATCMHAEKQQPPGGGGARAQEGSPSITASPPRRLAASRFRPLASFVFDSHWIELAAFPGAVGCAAQKRSATNKPTTSRIALQGRRITRSMFLHFKTQAYNFVLTF
jgi:hypothetical protein